MDTNQQKITTYAQISIVIASVIMLVGIFVTMAHTGDVAIFNFRFNPYALISLTSAAACLLFLLYVPKTHIRGTEAAWFYMFIACICLYGVIEAFQRLSATPEAAIFWDRLLGIVVFEAVAGYWFLMSYLDRYGRSVRMASVLFLSAALLFFFAANGNMLGSDQIEMKLYPWGYNDEGSPGFYYYVLWILTVTLAGLSVLISYIRRTTNTELKKQAKLFLYALLFPIVGGLITEDFIPLLTGGAAVIVPLHATFGTFTAALMIWGLHRYRVFKASPALFSGDILALMKEAVLVLDKEMRIVFMNKETEQAFAANGKSVEGTAARELLDEISGRRFIDCLASLKKGDTAYLDDITLLVGGSHEIYAQLAISRMNDENEFDGFIVVIADVTELKRSYEALEQEKASVERTVEVRTQELIKAQERLLEVDKLKTEFVLLTSHNLRTPLAIVQGSLDLLRSGNMPDDKKEQFLKEAETSIKKLGLLVEDLLTITTIESGDSLIMEEVRVSDLVVPLSEEANQRADTSNNTVHISMKVHDERIKANPKRLGSAIHNVLENAFKFTHAGTVRFEVASTDDRLVIIIQDSGIGIPEAELPKLFTKFHRATDTLAYNYEGKGIGLYLTKLIIEQHDGTISLQSAENKGTTVTITLPLLAQGPAGSVPASPPESPQATA